MNPEIACLCGRCAAAGVFYAFHAPGQIECFAMDKSGLTQNRKKPCKNFILLLFFVSIIRNKYNSLN